MKQRCWRYLLVLVLTTVISYPQRATTAPVQEEPRLPNGKLQREAILKAHHEQNLKDADKLMELAEQLKQDLEKNDVHVLSMSTLKKTDEIEKLAKKIRSRLRN